MNLIKNIDWHKVISTNFWFYVDPSQIHPSEIAFLYIGGILLILGLITLIFARFASNKFLARVSLWFSKIFFTIGFLELFWFLIRYERAMVLGSKFVAALILLIGIIWMYWPLKYLSRNYREDMERAQREASREKYLKRKV